MGADWAVRLDGRLVEAPSSPLQMLGAKELHRNDKEVPLSRDLLVIRFQGRIEPSAIKLASKNIGNNEHEADSESSTNKKKDYPDRSQSHPGDLPSHQSNEDECECDRYTQFPVSRISKCGRGTLT